MASNCFLWAFIRLEFGVPRLRFSPIGEAIKSIRQGCEDRLACARGCLGDGLAGIKKGHAELGQNVPVSNPLVDLGIAALDRPYWSFVTSVCHTFMALA